MTEAIRWGIISTGVIAHQFALGLEQSTTGTLTAVASRSLKSARAFAAKHNAPEAFDSYAKLLAYPNLDAVYIATPHPMHREWAIAAANAGKHILCEKPIGVTAGDAEAIVIAARRNDVFLMEAFMYRCHPQIARAVEIVKSGQLGDVRLIQASFGFRVEFDPESRLFSNALAGGSILDVGCYPVSLSRLIAGAALGCNAVNPISLTASGHLGETGVDEYAAAILTFENNIIAQVACGVSLEQSNTVTIFGTTGSLFIPEPWLPGGRDGGTAAEIVITRPNQEDEVIETQTAVSQYCLEADVVAANLDAREAAYPAMSWDDTIGNMQTLDRWRAAIELLYESE